jgi:hypothetical protein
MMKILKKLVWLIAFIPATAHSQYFGVTSSTTTGKASMTLVGQELLYPSTAATSASIILQGNGGRITANGITLKSSATVQGPLAVTGTVTAGGFSGPLSGNAATATALAAAGSTAGSGYVCRGVDASGNCIPAVVDATAISGSTNPVQSGGIYTALAGKQASGSYALSTGQAFTGNISAPNVTASTAIVSGNVSVGTTTAASTKLEVYGGDMRVVGASGFGATPTSGEGLEIAYDSANHYAWFGAYNRTMAAYTGNYVDGSTMGLNYYSKGPVIIGGNTTVPSLSATYSLSAATGTFTSTATLAAANITGNLKFTGSTPSSGYLLTSDSSGNASWTAPATGVVVLSATQTFSGSNIFTSSTTFNGGMFRGSYPLDVAQLVSSGTFSNSGSPDFLTALKDNQTYELVIVSSCTAATAIGMRVNYISSSVYEWLRTYKTSSGTSSYATTSGGYMQLGDTNSAGDTVIIRATIAVHTSGWVDGLSYAASSISSYVRSGSVNEENGGGWTTTGTQVTDISLIIASGGCSGKYKITTTGW